MKRLWVRGRQQPPAETPGILPDPQGGCGGDWGGGEEKGRRRRRRGEGRVLQLQEWEWSFIESETSLAASSFFLGLMPCGFFGGEEEEEEEKDGIELKGQ